MIFNVFYTKDWKKEQAKIRFSANVNEFSDWEDLKDVWVYLSFCPHRHYNLKNELELDWRILMEEKDSKEYNDIIEYLNTKYYWWRVDCYNHSSISFSLSGEWMQCQFDTSKRIWIIAIDKKEWSEAFFGQVARRNLEKYTERINWFWPREITLEEKFIYNREDGETNLVKRDFNRFIDWIYFSKEKELMITVMKNVAEEELREDGVEFDNIDIEEE